MYDFRHASLFSSRHAPTLELLLMYPACLANPVTQSNMAAVVSVVDILVLEGYLSDKTYGKIVVKVSSHQMYAVMFALRDVVSP